MPQTPLPATMIETVFPDQASHDGTWFDAHPHRPTNKAVFMAVSRHARKTVGTACSEWFDFQAVVPRCRRIELSARVVATERPAMTVNVDLAAEDLLSGGKQLCARAAWCSP